MSTHPAFVIPLAEEEAHLYQGEKQETQLQAPEDQVSLGEQVGCEYLNVFMWLKLSQRQCLYNKGSSRRGGQLILGCKAEQPLWHQLAQLADWSKHSILYLSHTNCTEEGVWPRVWAFHRLCCAGGLHAEAHWQRALYSQAIATKCELWLCIIAGVLKSAVTPAAGWARRSTVAVSILAGLHRHFSGLPKNSSANLIEARNASGYAS
jgi:hypothetical protein